jgi:hypothetical protein
MGDEVVLGDTGHEMLIALKRGRIKIMITSGHEVGLFRMNDGDVLILLAFILEHKPNLLNALPKRILNKALEAK